jgi:hypothetical protein
LLHQIGDLFELNVKLRCQNLIEILYVKSSLSFSVFNYKRNIEIYGEILKKV